MDFPELNAFQKCVPKQVGLSVSAYAVAKVFSLTAAAKITTVALQALGLVAAIALILDLAECTGLCSSTHIIDGIEENFGGLGMLQCVSTVGLFAIGVVAAPVAQYGMICALL